MEREIKVRRGRYPRSRAPHLAKGLTRMSIAALLPFLIVSGCRSDCLPVPENDQSPPDVRVSVSFRTPGGEERELHFGVEDTSRTIRVDASHRVLIRYTATDSSGLRSLTPGLTVQHTVGLGTERRHVPLRIVTASCPRAQLTAQHEAAGTGERRVLIITAGAENWVGRRASIEPLTLRLE